MNMTSGLSEGENESWVGVAVSSSETTHITLGKYLLSTPLVIDGKLYSLKEASIEDRVRWLRHEMLCSP